MLNFHFSLLPYLDHRQINKLVPFCMFIIYVISEQSFSFNILQNLYKEKCKV